MPKLLVLYYSMYGHIETLAGSIAEGARSVEGVEVTIKRVADLIPEDKAREHGAKSFELRTVLSLCRMWAARGRQAAARQLLADTYDSFTEGFGTADLREAASFLAALA